MVIRLEALPQLCMQGTRKTREGTPVQTPEAELELCGDLTHKARLKVPPKCVL